jgi:hypothetical protein
MRRYKESVEGVVTLLSIAMVTVVRPTTNGDSSESGEVRQSMKSAWQLRTYEVSQKFSFSLNPLRDFPDWRNFRLFKYSTRSMVDTWRIFETHESNVPSQSLRQRVSKIVRCRDE